MPRNISSSSEDEASNDSTAPSPTRNVRGEKSSRYQCPADFVSFCHKPCSSTLTDSLKNGNTELWLIKAPASFNPECFSGVRTPLSGLQTLQVPSAVGGAKDGGGSGQKIYSILASAHRSSELCLLTSHSQSPNKVVCGPTFSGLLNICESYGDSSTNQAPQVIPAAPAPSIPPGLKQRFQPFGSKTPTLTFVAESEADGAATGPSSATLLPRVVKIFPEEDEERKKRKKKKRDRREGEEEEREKEVVRVKQEPEVVTPDLGESMEIPRQEADVSEEKRKKKKKKKDREREEKEEEEVVEAGHSVKEEEIMVKFEPMDASYGDLEDTGKKKKKKKKSKHDDD